MSNGNPVVKLKGEESLASLQKTLLRALQNGTGITVITVEGPRRLGEILVDEGRVNPEDVDQILNKRKLLGQLLVEEGRISPEELDAALEKQRDEMRQLAQLFNNMNQGIEGPSFSWDHLDSIFRGMTDLLIVLNPDTTIRTVNPASLELLGYEEEELIGQPLEKFLVEELPLRGSRVDDFATVESITNVETEFLSKGGRKIPVLLSCSVIYDEDGRLQNITCVAKDIAERKRIEHELEEATRELSQRLEYVQKTQEQLIRNEKMASLGLMAAQASHEILNPLNIITMRIYMMLKDHLTPPEVARHLKTLEEQANRAAKIFQELLYFARQDPQEITRIDINELVTRTLALIERDLRLKSITVDLRLTESLPPVKADRGKLQQVVLNLITNARDAMPDGGSIILATDAVCSNGKDYVTLRVEDTGEGIAPENMDKLFDPFFTTKPVGEGTGLGLPVCQGIIESYEGSIWAENVPGGGAAFVVRLYAVKGWMARRILVVDDEPSACDLLCEFLESNGYKTLVAHNGDEALDVYKRNRPDMVLLDVRIPGKDGLEILRELKAIDPEVVVFIVTAVCEEGIQRQAKAEGAIEYITKPINQDYLELALKKRVELLEDHK